MKTFFFWVSLTTILFLPPVAIAQKPILSDTDQLDELDRQELRRQIDRAHKCIETRDLACVNNALKQASSVANSTADRNIIQKAQVTAQQVFSEPSASEREIRDRAAQARAELQTRSDAMAQESEAQSRQITRATERQTREIEAANRVAGARTLETIGRKPPPQDWLMAETQRTLAQTPQLIAQAQREKDREIADRQAAANQAARERLAARQEAQAAAEQRANAGVAQAREQRQAEQTRIAEQDRRDEQARRDREARDEQRRLEAQRLADAEAKRVARAKEAAEREAAKRAEVEAELRAKREYLNKLVTGTRLAARKCPDGEGKYYIVGVFPKVSPEIVSCKDVYFKATCPGDVVGLDGVGKNFLGAATDCFMGDTVKIEPLACKVDQVSVRVRDVRACGE